MKKSAVITLMSLILWVGGLQAAMIIVAADGSGDVTDTILISPGIVIGLLSMTTTPVQIPGEISIVSLTAAILIPA